MHETFGQTEIGKIEYKGMTLFFLAEPGGKPVTYGYKTHEEAERVVRLIEDSNGQATIPQGIYIEGFLD